MTELRRLLDDPAGELELEILRAATDDAPPPASLWKTAAALGIAAAATGTVGLGSATALAAAATRVAATSNGVAAAESAALGAAKGALGGTSLSLAAFVKPLVIGLVAGVAASAGVHYSAERPQAVTPARTSVTAVPRAEAPAPLPPPVSRTPAAELPVLPSDSAQTEPAAPDLIAKQTASSNARRAPERAPATTHVPRAAEPAPTAAFAGVEEPAALERTPEKSAAPARSLAPEVALLDRARSALVANDARAALSALATYDGAPRSGVFHPEAAMLRIQARLMLGDRAGAARLARSFVETYPGSRHVQSIQALADEAAR